MSFFPQSPGESDRAFAAFTAYLELGPQRRLSVTARKVGSSLRTVQRWANDFDWRGRIKAHTARCAEQYVEAQSHLQRAEVFDTAARNRAFLERQYALAGILLDVAERYLDRLEDCDLDQMRFPDACRALHLASLLNQPASGRDGEDATSPARNLRDQLATLLDQVCRDVPTPNGDDPSSPSTSRSPA